MLLFIVNKTRHSLKVSCEPAASDAKTQCTVCLFEQRLNVCASRKQHTA